jgi:hypothetical protein
MLVGQKFEATILVMWTVEQRDAAGRPSRSFEGGAARYGSVALSVGGRIQPDDALIRWHTRVR